MLGELALRFVLGGLIVCAFAALGDRLRPKSFAGVFGAAPSVALASLGLTFIVKGAHTASVDGHAMMAGGVALGVYSALVAGLLLSWRWNTIVATVASWAVWLAVAFGLWAVALR